MGWEYKDKEYILSALQYPFLCRLLVQKTQSINVFSTNNSKYMPYGLTVVVGLHITSLALVLSTLINKGAILPTLQNFSCKCQQHSHKL